MFSILFYYIICFNRGQYKTDGVFVFCYRVLITGYSLNSIQAFFYDMMSNDIDMMSNDVDMMSNDVDMMSNDVDMMSNH